MTNQAVAVVFARGTGDAVPLLNARLLGGKPVLNYTIQAAQQSANVSKVFVSTEDERIAAVALAAGAEVIMRPEELSTNQAPLSAAVEHAAEALKEPLLAVGGHMLCLPADAVFCDTPLIDRALDTYFSGDYDHLIALLPENKKYVIWRELDDHRLESLVAPPHLRSDSERLFSEPGVLTVWRVDGSAVPIPPMRMGYITIDDNSAFRVDTEYDLWAAERLIAPNHLALRCDGSREMGMGHVMRLLYIADYLEREDPSGWVVRFFVGSDHLEGAQLLTQRGFDVDIVRQDDTSHWVRRLEAFRPMVIVNDLPFVPAQYSEELSSLSAKTLMLVDSVADIEPGSSHLDTVISYMEEDLQWPHNSYHNGLGFAPLHPSVTSRLDHALSRSVRPGKLRVLVAFGSGDPAGLTQPAMAALAETQQHWSQVFVSVQRDQQDSLFRETLGRLNCPVEIIDSPTDGLGEYLDQSDLALVSGGTTAYEVSALGVPAIVLCQNQRELIRMQQFERKGSIVLLGMGNDTSRAQLARTLNRVVTDVSLRERMSAAGQEATDGRGVERISEIIKEQFGNLRISAV